MPMDGDLPLDHNGQPSTPALRVLWAFQERLVAECQYVETMLHDGRP